MVAFGDDRRGADEVLQDFSCRRLTMIVVAFDCRKRLRSRTRDILVPQLKAVRLFLEGRKYPGCPLLCGEHGVFSHKFFAKF